MAQNTLIARAGRGLLDVLTLLMRGVGALLSVFGSFVLFAWRNEEGATDTSEKEIKAQIDNFIKDEVFFKEAVAMGLDKSDPAVKRRLRQLMELMMELMIVVTPAVIFHFYS